MGRPRTAPLRRPGGVDTLGRMAILATDDRRVALAANALVGRSSACTLRVEDPRASAEHARITHRDGAWSVRDLGSRNGTFVNDARIEPGGATPLSAGDRITFGKASAVWTLVDASPPVAMARRLPEGDYIAASADGMLALPSPDEPSACVFEQEPGVWTIEIDGQARPAADGEVLSLGQASFMLHLPVPLVSTVESPDPKPRPDPIELRFRVSPDEESVEVMVVDASGPRVLAPRTHHYTLLTLARLRARDNDKPELTGSQRGWVFVDELCRMLSMDEHRLNTEVHRIRQDMAAARVPNPTGVVERRRGSRQLRVTTDRVSIATMG